MQNNNITIIAFTDGGLSADPTAALAIFMLLAIYGLGFLYMAKFYYERLLLWKEKKLRDYLDSEEVDLDAGGVL